MADLKAKLNENSSNSSKPPSSDGPGVPRPETKPTGRKRGAQAGHKGHRRELVEPTRVVEVKPERCEECAHELQGTDAKPWRHQVTDTPPVLPETTEYRCHLLKCDRCGHRTRAPLPPGVPTGAFGPRLTAIIGLLTGTYRLSKRMVPDLLRDLLGVNLSDGSVCGAERHVSEAIAAPVDELRDLVRVQRDVHMDETGWREDKKRAWLWTATTLVGTVFVIERSRGSAVARRILGETFLGHLVTDRWSAYNWLDPRRRQLCWAHLIRDFQWIVDRGRSGARTARSLLREIGDILWFHRRMRAGQFSREKFVELVAPFRRRVGLYLRRIAASDDRDAAGMCAEILKLEGALWTFVDVDGLEPTNTAAERALRPAVIWRKSSFGTDSASGSRFVERVLSAVATLRQHARPVLDFLTAAVRSRFEGAPAPSLVGLSQVAAT